MMCHFQCRLQNKQAEEIRLPLNHKQFISVDVVVSVNERVNLKIKKKEKKEEKLRGKKHSMSSKAR